MASRFKKLVYAGFVVGTGAYFASSFINVPSFDMKAVSAAEIESKKRNYRRAKRSLPHRSDQIKSLQNESFDVLIIGGGATGAGCALDAVSRGQ